jgi:glyoxylase-like metal-dependent hydrolase (beta-lactamase superfamily II)
MQNVSRRTFLTAASGMALCAAWRPAAAQVAAPPAKPPKTDDTKFFEWKPVAEGVDAGIGGGGNSMVIRGKGAAAIVDCKLAPFGPVLRREAAGLGTPITQVINTHHHADHTGGNWAFSPDIPIVIHQRALPRIQQQVDQYQNAIRAGERTLGTRIGPAADAIRADIRAALQRLDSLTAFSFLPRASFSDRKDLDIGGVTVALIHFGSGHTDNDIIVCLPQKNVIHAGDLLFMGRHPVMDRPAGATTVGWCDSLRKVIEMCDAKTHVVPGHGELTDVAGLRGQIEYFEKMREFIGAAIKEGKSRDEVVKLPVPEAYANYGSSERTVGAIFDELSNKPA